MNATLPAAATTPLIVDADPQGLLITLVDNAGLVRAKLVPGRRVGTVAATGVGLSPTFAVFSSDSSITVSSAFGGPSGDMRLIPDLQAAVCVDPATGLWWAPVDQLDQELRVMSCCQRSALKRMQQRAHDAGLEFRMTFELEFTVLRGSREAPEFGHAGPSYGVLAFVELEEFLIDLVRELETVGVQPEVVHPEYGPGQVEFCMAPAAPLVAADRQVLARLATHRVARAHGLRVSFSPLTAVDAIGNGCHVHFSAFADGQNVFAGDNGLPGPVGGQMIGSLVEHLPDLTGVFAPSPLSYERLLPGHWAGANACWGVENREAAVRYIPGTSTSRASSANVEVKIADATSNPYLVAAALLAMALRGVADGTPLPKSVAQDPQALDDSERRAANLRGLPSSIGEALDALAASELAGDAFGPELLDAFVAVRRRDIEVLGDLEPADKIAAMRWLY